MLRKYVSDIAKMMNIPLSKVEFVEGSELGCTDIHILSLYSKGKISSALIHDSDYTEFKKGKLNYNISEKVNSALERFQAVEESSLNN